MLARNFRLGPAGHELRDHRSGLRIQREAS
jgi:hypothetical protein